MKVRALDATGDWVFGTGRSAYLKDQNALAQQIRCNLYSFLNDCFWDQETGIDWFGFLGGKDQTGLLLAISSTILGTQGVTALTKLTPSLSRTTRAFTAQYAAQTIYSQLTGSISFNLPV